jgi:ferredoxin
MNTTVDPELYQEVEKFGAKDMEICMQCATCSASCPLSEGTNPFPRKIYRYLQLGLRDKLLQAPEPWLCYYCGECNKDCPREAEPAETMMATRRWLTTQYDWTGLAKRFYLSAAWEIGALAALAFGIILLFWFYHGPIITDRVSVNSFAPVMWIEIGDLIMAAILSAFLLSNAFRMYRFIMSDTKVPFSLYITEAKTFVLHFMTQKRWRQCGEDRSRWLKHFLLVTGYMTMMTQERRIHPPLLRIIRLAFLDPPFLNNAHRHYYARSSPRRLADGNICHVCHPLGSGGAHAGYRGPFRKMVTSLLPAAGRIFNYRQGEGSERLPCFCWGCTGRGG